MTMTDERLAELDAAIARFPVSLPWTSTPTERDGVTGIHGEPHPVGDKFAVAYLADVFGNAAPVVEVMNAIPDLRAHIDAQAATIARQDEALREIVGLVVEAIDLERIGAVVALDAIADVAHAALKGAA